MSQLMNLKSSLNKGLFFCLILRKGGKYGDVLYSKFNAR